MIKLYVTTGLRQEAVYELRNDITFLGRSPDNHIPINDPSVSRKHASITRRGERFYIKDLGSRNGTWINGHLKKSDTEFEIQEGIPIAIGNTLISLAKKSLWDNTSAEYTIDLAEHIYEKKVDVSYREKFLTDRKRLELIYEVSNQLMQSLDILEICERIMASLFDCLKKIDGGAIIWVDDETQKPTEILARSRNPDKPFEIAYSRATVKRVLSKGHAIMVSDTGLEDPVDLSASTSIMRLKSIMCVPLISKSEIRGVIYVHSVNTPQGFQKEDLLLFTALSTPAALAIDNALLFQKTKKAEAALHKAHDELEQRVEQRTKELSETNERLTLEVAERKRAEKDLARAREQEVEIAARIQKSLLLGTPPTEVKGLQIAALTIPSQGIDGDFCDFFAHSELCMDLIIGDVMGKGIPAALLGAGTKNQFFRAMTSLIPLSRQLPQPEKIVQWAHDRIVKELIALESFVTLCYARFDLKRQCIDFVDCGHPKTIHFHPSSSTWSRLGGNDLPMGFALVASYHQESAPFQTGDIFLFYSDGITEAQNRKGEFFGEERLLQCIERNSGLSPKDLINRIGVAVLSFSRSETFADDLTCVAVKIAESREALSLVHLEMEMASNLKELKKATRFARNLVQQKMTPPLDEKQAWEFELAVNEVVVNIIKHGCEGELDRKIHMEANVFIDRVMIQMKYRGKAFDRASIPPPMLDGSQESGYGLFLIDQSMDQVIYTRDETGMNTICLVKNRRNP